LDGFAARDARVRVIHQENTGLTQVLVRGCAEARGEFIARQDADDVSLPGRLAKQSAFLKANPNVALVSCWTQFIGPEDEPLNEVCRHDSPAEATAKLKCGDVSRIQGISGHGTAMFRRTDYLRAGGYRPEFYFAQDLDLWLRLTDFGQLAFVPELLYQARFGTADISGKYHREQQTLTAIMIEAQKARQKGLSEETHLANAATIRCDDRRSTRRQLAAGPYFIGKMLLKRGDLRGRKYLWQALRVNPLHWRALAALARGN
jgi:hypothetical protein